MWQKIKSILMFEIIKSHKPISKSGFYTSMPIAPDEELSKEQNNE